MIWPLLLAILPFEVFFEVPNPLLHLFVLELQDFVVVAVDHIGLGKLGVGGLSGAEWARSHKLQAQLVHVLGDNLGTVLKLVPLPQLLLHSVLEFGDLEVLLSDLVLQVDGLLLDLGHLGLQFQSRLLPLFAFRLE